MELPQGEQISFETDDLYEKNVSVMLAIGPSEQRELQTDGELAGRSSALSKLELEGGWQCHHHRDQEDRAVTTTAGTSRCSPTSSRRSAAGTSSISRRRRHERHG
eukprot:8182619-Heterocapsa_arctica.AAC.1